MHLSGMAAVEVFYVLLFAVKMLSSIAEWRRPLIEEGEGESVLIHEVNDAANRTLE